MRKFCYILPLLLSLLSCANARYARGSESEDIETLPVCDGTIKALPYKSSDVGLSERRMVVYLPPNYYKEPEKRYPVMYLLHGARGNEATWIERGDALRTLDSLVRIGAAPEFILVMPNMNRYYNDREYNNGHAVNAIRAFWTVDGEVESNFMTDVVRTVDGTFRTINSKSARAIAGMSSGGLQALYLAANNPHSFDYVGLFSPYTQDTPWGYQHPEFYGRLGHKMKKQFADPPAYYGLMIGDTDFFYPNVLLFDREMKGKGYEHELIIRPGGHEWYNWRAFLIHFYQVVSK